MRMALKVIEADDPTPADVPRATGGPGRRALVVDDDAEFCQVLVDYLGRRGVEAWGVGDGATAVRVFADYRPHLVFLDLAMPGFSGVETLRRIKSLPWPTWAVIVSGRETPEARQLTRVLGADNFMPKPVDFGHLDRLLDAQLGAAPRPDGR
jgi:DNA-binding response OmpR family regulator